MNKAIMIAAIVTATGLAAKADITINLPQGTTTGELEVQHGYISAQTGGNTDGKPASVLDKVKVVKGTAHIATMPDGPSQYAVSFGDRRNVLMIYTQPGEDIVVNITSEQPLRYTATGSRLMEDISAMHNETVSYLEEFNNEQRKDNPDVAKIESLGQKYYAVYTDYIKNNPDSPAAVYALMFMPSEEFLKNYTTLTPAARKSMLMPYAERQKDYVERQMEIQRRQMEFQSGNVDAPDFTFKNRDGKDISLSDFKGKWVVIDFWGSWCGWCIKGIPQMKEAYNAYKPKLEIVGVACNDSREAWINALDKYQLPWVNLYNPTEGGGPILEKYFVEGFPTKVIVNPEGKVVNVTSGEDPAFYELLERLIKGQSAEPAS